MPTDPQRPDGFAEEPTRFEADQPVNMVQELKADYALRKRRAEELISRYAGEIAAAPSRMVFVFDLVGGDYVCALNRWEALDLFDAKFVREQTHGWVHAPGNPLFVGGGLGWRARQS